jgi:hypothetical protein
MQALQFKFRGPLKSLGLGQDTESDQSSSDQCSSSGDEVDDDPLLTKALEEAMGKVTVT